MGAHVCIWVTIIKRAASLAYLVQICATQRKANTPTPSLGLNEAQKETGKHIFCQVIGNRYRYTEMSFSSL